MNRAKQFGETVEGYDIPVLNEREIRASAGILFLFLFTAWMLILFKDNFLLVKYAITIFFADFIIRVLIDPKLSPSLIVGRWIVRKQKPEYVGAIQKKYAWTIGLVLSSIMFLLIVLLNSYSFINGIICQICLIFMFFEAAFGICLGCSVYGWFHKGKAQYCPGETCDVKARHADQKTSLPQIGMLIGFLAYIFVIAYLFNGRFSEKPVDLWFIIKSVLSNIAL
jgi:hypothetical protein